MRTPLNWIDRAVGFVSPERGERRAAARTRMDRSVAVRNIYEAASVGRRTQGWRPVSTDVNAENRTALARLREVTRDMVRNNPRAASAKLVIANNTVGSGLLPRVIAARPERVAAIKALLRRHFDTTDIDADGRLNLYGLQNLAMATVAEAGEVLIRRRIRRPQDGYALPFQVQVLEPDFLNADVEGVLANGNIAVQGVEYDVRGRRVAYHLFDEHPGAVSRGPGSKGKRVSQRVSADFVAHVYRVDRPGQVRGVSWFAPVIVRMHDLADYADAQLVRQKIAACFAAFITTNADAAGDDDDLDGAGGTSATGLPLEQIEPGIIERLRPGQDVTTLTPPGTADFGPYESVTLHEIAAGLGIPFEALTGNLGEVSFISGRLGRIQFRANVDAWRWNMLVPQMLDPLAAWTLEAAAVVTGSSEPFGLGWTPPRWEMLSPKEEIASSKDAIRAGLSWLSEEQRVAGFDPEDVRAGMLEDQRWADANGVILDSDPRRVTTRGVAQKDADPNAGNGSD